MAKAFDPMMVANYPVKQVLDAAKAEWSGSGKAKAPEKDDGEADAGEEKPGAEKTGGDSGEGTEHNGPEVGGEKTGGGASPTTWDEYKKLAPEPKDAGTPYVKPNIPVADAQKIAGDFLDKIKADLELFSKDGFAIPTSRTAELKSISKLLGSFNEGKLSFLDRGNFLTEMKMLSRRAMFKNKK
jgi:hypothetical protein